MASALRRPLGALATAAGAVAMSSTGHTGTGNERQSAHFYSSGATRSSNLFQRPACWTPIMSLPRRHESVACDDKVKPLTRKKSQIIPPDAWTQRQNDIAKHVDFVSLLGDSELMQDIPTAFIEKVVSEGGTRIFAKRGTKLITQGEINDKLFVVGHGTLVVEVDEHRVAEVDKGQCVGEQAALTLQRATADVSVMTASAYMLVIDKDGLTKCTVDCPEILANMLTIISRREVKNQSLNLLSQIPSFENCSQEFLEAMAEKLKLVTFPVNEEVVSMNTTDDKGMFFVRVGELGIYDAKGMVAELGPNKFFGETMLLSGAGAKRFATVRAHTFVEAFQLPRKDFLLVATKFPKDFDQMKKVSKERSAFLLGRKTSIRKKD